MTPATEYRQLTRIFLAVCELERAERSRRLDLLCKEQPELRSEVEYLLIFHDRIPASSNGGDIL